MTSVAPILLTTDQMASFVARGYLRFDGVVPDAVNQKAMVDLPALLQSWVKQFVALSTGPGATGSAATEHEFDEAAAMQTSNSGTPLYEAYGPETAFGQMIRVPEITGAILSLVGAAPVFDHSFAHLKPPHDVSWQRLHCDAIVDPNTAFDIQLFWFPHDIAPGAGGTRFVPGSHLRQAHNDDIGRYQHLAGDQYFTGVAGTVLIFHHGLWHAGAPNHSDQLRVMGKLRINPTTSQVRLWDTTDLDERNTHTENLFALSHNRTVASVLRERQPWYNEASYRHELVQRSKLWRYLSGDNKFDVDWYLTRQEMRQRIVSSL